MERADGVFYVLLLLCFFFLGVLQVFGAPCGGNAYRLLLLLAAVPFNGQLHLSFLKKCFNTTSRVSVRCADAAQAARLQIPVSSPNPVHGAENRDGCSMKKGGVPLSDPLGVTVPGPSASGEQLSLEQDQLRGEKRGEML